MPASQCPKCGSSMEEGYLLESKHGNARDTTRWVEGEPERSFWTGLKLKGHAMLPVETFRCKRCGFLESYARDGG